MSCLSQVIGSIGHQPIVASTISAAYEQNRASAPGGLCRNTIHQNLRSSRLCSHFLGTVGSFPRPTGYRGKNLSHPKRNIIEATAVAPRMAETKPVLISEAPEWQDLKKHVAEISDAEHDLRHLLVDEERCKGMIKEYDGIILDYSRQKATTETMKKLFKLAEAAKLKEKIDKMFKGEHINTTEDRAVLHVALRAPRDKVITSDGKNVVEDVWAVLDKIKAFSDKVRNGEWKGATGKPLTDVVAIGIGGSFLGPLFVHTALRTEPHTATAAKGRRLRFLANVDPIDVANALQGLKQETTLVVVVSKTFTTAETMLNARTVRTWLTSALGDDAVAKHVVAVSTNLKLVKEFGIDPENAFAFWDWVGGRYSVTSAVGVVPLSLQYGFDNVQKFLEGAWSVDEHFHTAPLEENLPVLTGLLSVWNNTFLGCPARAILPYCQALSKLAPHIQQVSMESNGKGVSIDGLPLPYAVGEVDFGEPGTNGQHSFYQLIHQGRIIPCDFIGIIKSQQSVYLKDEIVSNHDELMCNFFAQADALAYGKTEEEVRSEGVAEKLVPHKKFTGNRPSLSILLPNLTPYTVGQLLALYENRVATQGFVWGINSFDQWGVELGKVLAKQVRSTMNAARTEGKQITGFNYSTTYLLKKYLEGKTQLLYPEPKDVFPSDILASAESHPVPDAVDEPSN
ncbi:cytosolic phosphoglucose isomerase [Klebsormidium nitens]|uniref:Glucose-6-phosphate isomerase n=1 Tax=Klebsormidium nitens TaxID=105231 RepID=A0A1Y1INL5_KLENI|nr:cytosolic phosphoglucose isomerase [Klebsormidium nitens]|eukprot:GAQ90376.1 cytosolic phosphoglucose isomerase [Klebsormidium nitens]